MNAPRYSSLTDYLAVIRRRKWTILAVIVVAAVVSYAVSTRQQKVYEASAQVLVTNTTAAQILGQGQQSSDQQTRAIANLAETAHTSAVAQKAASAANLPGVDGATALQITTVSPSTVTNVLTFSVRSRSPEVATRLANAYAAAFTLYAINAQEAPIKQTRNVLVHAKNKLVAQAATDKLAGRSTSALNAQINKLVGKIANLQGALASLTSGTNQGITVSAAASHATQVQPKVKQNVLLGLILGAVFGVIVAFIREALDTRVRSIVEIDAALGVTLLARIPSPSRTLRSANSLAMVEGDAVESEPYRRLRVSFDFSNIQVRAKTVMITSALNQEGKSTTIANLAYALALSGRRVIAADLDLRRPFLNNFFKVEPEPGITDALLGAVGLDDCLVSMPVPASPGYHGSLSILPAGRMPPNPSELMESDALGEMLGNLAERADIVLVDSAPLLPVVDSVALSRQVDGLIVLVHATSTKRQVLGELHRVLDTVGCPVLGYILAGVGRGGGYGYQYGYGYGPGDSTQSGVDAQHGAEPHNQNGTHDHAAAPAGRVALPPS